MLLRETCDGEVGFAAMMKYGEDLHGEGDRSDVQCCFETERVSNSSRCDWGKQPQRL